MSTQGCFEALAALERDQLSIHYERFLGLKKALAAVPADAVGRRRFEAVVALDSFTVGPDHTAAMRYRVSGGDGKPTIAVGDVAGDIVEVWREEMERTPHWAMKAHYAHLLWEREHDQGDAHVAIDAYSAASDLYIEAIELRGQKAHRLGLEFSRVLGIAIRLAAHVRDDERLVRAAGLASGGLRPLLASKELAAFEDIAKSLLQTRGLRSHLCHDAIGSIVEKAACLAETSGLHEWHRRMLQLRVRQAQLRKNGELEKILRQRTAQSHATEARHYAEVGHRMAASASYMAAIRELKGAGIKGAELDALMNANRAVLAGLGADEFTSTEIEADADLLSEMPSLSNTLVAEHGAKAILHLPLWTAPHLPEIEAQVRSDYSSLILLTTAKVYGDARVVADESSTASIFDFHVRRDYMVHILLYGSYFVNQLVKKMVHEAGLSANELAAVIDSVGVVEDWRRQFIHHALAKYVDGDILAFMFIIVPQVEGIIRNMLALLGCPVDVEKDGLTQARTLNDMLCDPALSKRLGTNVIYQLKSVFTDRSGPNLRNLLAHGLPFECTPMTAGLVLLALFNACSRWALDVDAQPGAAGVPSN